MVELRPLTPCAGLLPLSVGSVTLQEAEPGVLTLLAPWGGQEKPLSEALKASHGLALPSVGRATGKDGARAIWFGRGQTLLVGPVPDVGLTKHAAVTDQSDGWAVVRLDGQGAEDVLARLAPVDLRKGTFKRGHSLRTELAHMSASITRLGDKAFQIMVFRSMAHTLVHEMHEAMISVAAHR